MKKIIKFAVDSWNCNSTSEKISHGTCYILVAIGVVFGIVYGIQSIC